MYCNCRAIIEHEREGIREILIQIRNKPCEGRTRIELPGGRVEEFESLVDTLRREVREETGLDLSHIEGQHNRIETNGMDANVECIQPFAAYQTLRGPVDSIGFYFRCQAEGQPAETGDESWRPRWMAVSEVAKLMSEDPEQFSFVDQAGLAFYFKRTRSGLQA